MNIATDPLEEVKGVLDDLENALKKKKSSWEQIEADNPGFLEEENCREKHTLCWLHGATDNREARELERWLFDKMPLSNIAKSNAAESITSWKAYLDSEDAYEPLNGFRT